MSEHLALLAREIELLKGQVQELGRMLAERDVEAARMRQMLELQRVTLVEQRGRLVAVEERLGVER